MLKYKLFNANIIKIVEYAKIMQFYQKHEQASIIVNYLKTNEFNLKKFKNFLSILSKRNACKSNESLQYSYEIKVEIVNDIIIIQEKIFDQKLKWFRKNEYTNYRRPMMFPDNNGHIVEYRQIKITKDINIM
ncbi:10281_t:CDS:2, partial [Gigaspora rosea]